MASTASSTKKTKYQKLVSRKKSFCQGKALKTQVKTAAAEYVADAVKKAGATKAAEAKKKATAIANKILNAGCKMSSVITGAKNGKKA